MTTARAENLDAMLKIEAMRLFYGCQTISNDEFLREREVVRNEISPARRHGRGPDPAARDVVGLPAGHAYEG